MNEASAERKGRLPGEVAVVTGAARGIGRARLSSSPRRRGSRWSVFLRDWGLPKARPQELNKLNWTS
jgi:hypothetical protein